MPAVTLISVKLSGSDLRRILGVLLTGLLACHCATLHIDADDRIERGTSIRQTGVKNNQGSRSGATIRRLPSPQPVISEAAPRIETDASWNQPHEPAQTRSMAPQTVRYVTPILNDLSNEVVPEELEQAWWLTPMQKPFRKDAEPLHISLASLLVQTLQHSYQIKVFNEVPQICETSIVEADAAFDWYGFLESRWDDTNDPVGSTLTGVPIGARYKNNQFSSAAGMRRRTLIGGKVEAAQRFGFQDSNSIYLVPAPQGTARLTLGYTQPLLRGSGQTYTTSLICLAQIDKSIAEKEFTRQAQSHLLEVARAFWGLHIARATVVQKRNSLKLGLAVAKQLREREEIDAASPQIQRAEAEIATREAELIRAQATVRNAEGRIRSLVNDPALGSPDDVELIPMDVPLCDPMSIDLKVAMARAVQYRPEVHQSLQQIKASSIRLDMSKNEVLPLLNLTAETYVAGLQNNGSVGDAYTDQFSVGSPTYAFGSQFEYPLGNRAAQARADRRVLQLRQVHSQFETTLKILKLEVGTAVRELRTSYAEMISQAKAARAGSRQLDQIVQRWKLLPGEDGNGSLVLDNMLNAQNRVVKAESAYLNAWITYNLAMINLKKSTGELLQHEDVSLKDFRAEIEGVTDRSSAPSRVYPK